MTGPAGRSSGAREYVVIGRICGIFGVNGCVRVESYTRPRENLLGYNPWYIAGQEGRWQRVCPAGGRHQGAGWVVSLEGVGDREHARIMLGYRIAVRREQLPQPAPGEYYWCDLVGLRVEDMSGRYLGDISAVQETRANDVLVVEGNSRYLIPVLPGNTVKEIDLQGGCVKVDWNPEYL